VTPVQLLIEALRSGNYTQGRSRLAGFDLSQKQWQYCCLGVACELYQEHVGGLPVEIRDGEKLYDRQNSHLPEKVRKWLGFKEDGGSFVEALPSPDGRDRRTDRILAINPEATNQARQNKTYCNLVNANDDGYFTFEEIADILEAGKVRGTEAYAAC
jgi:hypothetical protein